MKTQVPAKKPESGAQSYLPTFNHAVSNGTASNATLQNSHYASPKESALHASNYNLLNVPIQHKSGTPQQSKAKLPNNIKASLESLTNISMEDVSVHYNSTKPAQLRSLAYTQGTAIYIAPGQEKHLPHEAWHVVQQKQGRVKATAQINNELANLDESLELEADTLGKTIEKKAKSCHFSKFTQQEQFMRSSISPQEASNLQPIQAKFAYQGKVYDQTNSNSWNKNIHGIKRNDILKLAVSDTDYGTLSDLGSFQTAIGNMNTALAVQRAAALAVPQQIVYPFPNIYPKSVYRWCSAEAAKDATTNGIRMMGGIHDGIPTVPAQLEKSYAKKGGGMGIVNSQAQLMIDLMKIPEIAAKQDNSLRKTTAKVGAEWKIMVDIPAEAIKRIS